MSTIPLQRSQRHCLQAPGDLLIPDGSSITIAYQSARVLVAATLPQDYRHIVQQLIYILLSFRMFLFPQFSENLHELNPFPVDFNQCSAWSTESKHIGTPHTHATYIHLCAHILYTNAHGCLRAVHRGTLTNTSTHLSSFSIAMHHILFYYILCFPMHIPFHSHFYMQGWITQWDKHSWPTFAGWDCKIRLDGASSKSLEVFSPLQIPCYFLKRE